jgi:basic membrane protein A and related proteins
MPGNLKNFSKEKWMKKILVLLMCMLMVTGMLFAGGEAEEGAGDDVTKIALLLNGTLGDKSFFDSADNGMKMLKEEFGDKVEVRTIEMSYDQTKWEPTLLDISEEDYDVIIVGTWQMTEMLEAAAPMYPDNNYVIFDTAVNYAGGDFDNVYSIGYKQNEVSFVAGALAAKVTMSDMPLANDEKVVGFLGGMDIPVINDFLVGYIEGVQYVDKGIKVGISYIGSFSDSAKGKEMALAQYNQGADIGFNVAGQAGLGQLDAAKDVQRYAIGVDSDQAEIFAVSDPEKANLITTSALKRVDNSLYRAVKMHMEGTAPYGTAEVLGFAEECVGLADNDIFKSVVPQEIRDFVLDVEQKIMDGDIVVSSAFGLTTEELNALRNAVK